ncbi:DNA-packaging protein [Erwinia psidii]|uniref:DNA-packaging protein n=1 Tax=Erwinia psidii TaxID=69224 RepID=UPI00226B51DE|nr:DNA-packaging protein [Erwinia psidii]MCX8965131.1 DNA-packaging protein [Erwinia psidii]
MAAPKGNRFWEARSSHGRKPIFESPDALWSACCEYFEWVEQNPLWEMKAFAYQGDVKQATVAKMRAMTIVGLCIFLDITRQTWGTFRLMEDFSDITTRAEEIIYDQKFSGAAADLLNANIIARDLGLAEKREVKQTVTDLTDEEIDKRIRELNNAESQQDPEAGTAGATGRKKASQ